VSKEMVAKARPTVLREVVRKAANARWANSTPETLAAFIAMVNRARAAKRHARMKNAA